MTTEETPRERQGEKETPEELREHIEHTREDLGHTVEALAAKADIKARARDKAAEMRQRIGGRAPSEVPRPGRRGSMVAVGGGALAVAGLMAGWMRRRRQRVPDTPWQRAVHVGRDIRRQAGSELPEVMHRGQAVATARGKEIASRGKAAGMRGQAAAQELAARSRTAGVGTSPQSARVKGAAMVAGALVVLAMVRRRRSRRGQGPE